MSHTFVNYPSDTNRMTKLVRPAGDLNTSAAALNASIQALTDAIAMAQAVLATLNSLATDPNLSSDGSGNIVVAGSSSLDSGAILLGGGLTGGTSGDGSARFANGTYAIAADGDTLQTTNTTTGNIGASFIDTGMGNYLKFYDYTLTSNSSFAVVNGETNGLFSSELLSFRFGTCAEFTGPGNDAAGSFQSSRGDAVSLGYVDMSSHYAINAVGGSKFTDSFGNIVYTGYQSDVVLYAQTATSIGAALSGLFNNGNGYISAFGGLLPVGYPAYGVNASTQFAGYFGDGSNVALLSDGTYAINAIGQTRLDSGAVTTDGSGNIAASSLTTSTITSDNAHSLTLGSTTGNFLILGNGSEDWILLGRQLDTQGNIIVDNVGTTTLSLAGGAFTTDTGGNASAASLILNSTTTPGSPVAGQIYFDGTNFQGYNGTAWVQLDN